MEESLISLDNNYLCAGHTFVLARLVVSLISSQKVPFGTSRNLKICTFYHEGRNFWFGTFEGIYDFRVGTDESFTGSSPTLFYLVSTHVDFTSFSRTEEHSRATTLAPRVYARSITALAFCRFFLHVSSVIHCFLWVRN